MTEKEMIVKHGSENMCDLLNQEQAELKKAMIEEMPNFSFIVIDNKTGKEADDYNIALKEDWAKGLIYCDMEGFAILEDGTLVLLDECGNVAYCPSGRFTVIPEGAIVIDKDYLNLLKQTVAAHTRKETAREILDLLYSRMPKTQIVVEIGKRYGVKITD